MSTSSLSLVMEGASLESMRRKPILAKTKGKTLVDFSGEVHVGIRMDGTMIINIHMTITCENPVKLQIATHRFSLGPLDQIFEAYEKAAATEPSESCSPQVLKELKIRDWPNGKIILYTPTRMVPQSEPANSNGPTSHRVSQRVSCIS